MTELCFYWVCINLVIYVIYQCVIGLNTVFLITVLGIVLSVKIQAEKRVQRERRLRDACEQELMKYREYCAAQESEIESLRGLLRKHGISDIIQTEIPKPASRIDVVAEVNQVDDSNIVTKTKEQSPDIQT